MILDTTTPAGKAMFRNRNLEGTLVLDMVTGRPIRKVRWANDQSGWYEAWLTDDAGRIVCDLEGIPQKVRRRTRLKFVFPPDSNPPLYVSSGVPIRMGM